MLLTGYQTPAAIRRIGLTRLTAWLANRKVGNAGAVAATVLDAARSQRTTLPGIGAELVVAAGDPAA